jgi:hypothetical protein
VRVRYSGRGAGPLPPCQALPSCCPTATYSDSDPCRTLPHTSFISIISPVLGVARRRRIQDGFALADAAGLRASGVGGVWRMRRYRGWGHWHRPVRAGHHARDGHSGQGGGAVKRHPGRGTLAVRAGGARTRRDHSPLSLMSSLSLTSRVGLWIISVSRKSVFGDWATPKAGCGTLSFLPDHPDLAAGRPRAYVAATTPVIAAPRARPEPGRCGRSAGCEPDGSFVAGRGTTTRSAPQGGLRLRLPQAWRPLRGHERGGPRCLQPLPNWGGMPGKKRGRRRRQQGKLV